MVTTIFTTFHYHQPVDNLYHQ